MHNAPSVSYPVGRSRFLGGLLALLWCAGVSAVALWCQQATPSGWRRVAAAGAVLLSAGVAVLAWRRQPEGLLTWDGQAWSWRGCMLPAGASPRVVMDFQAWMLLGWPAPARAEWLWLERRHAPGRWRDLRRAVYSRARILPLPGADSGPATP